MPSSHSEILELAKKLVEALEEVSKPKPRRAKKVVGVSSSSSGEDVPAPALPSADEVVHPVPPVKRVVPLAKYQQKRPPADKKVMPVVPDV